MRAFLDHTGFDPRCKRCLDIGPAHGDSLDVLHEQGADECAFIELDLWFFRHNSLKPYAHGWNYDHFRHLHRLPVRAYDFIWNRGAFASDGRFLRIFGRIGFSLWLRQVEKRAAPGALIMFCPYRGATEGMVRVLRSRGYKPLPFIAGHNTDLYPVTWIKYG